MSKITYLIGAGASAGAAGDKLPVVANMPERLAAFWVTLRDLKLPADSNKVSTAKEKLMGELEWLLYSLVEWDKNTPTYEKHIRRVSSIDTLAKQLTIKGQLTELLRLKRVLSMFLFYEHFSRGIDLRYDSLFAALIDADTKELPDLRVICWNYDIQLESAHAKYFDGKKPFDDGLVSELDILIKNADFTRTNSSFQLFKLNGCISFKEDDSRQIPRSNNGTIAAHLVSMLSIYAKAARTVGLVESLLSFCWEEDRSSVIEAAKTQCQGTDVLVVIGYSFPFFNRKVDKEILDEMDLEKVYIQDKYPERILERFRATYPRHPVLSDNQIVLVNDIDQFVLPDELSI